MTSRQDGHLASDRTAFGGKAVQERRGSPARTKEQATGQGVRRPTPWRQPWGRLASITFMAFCVMTAGGPGGSGTGWLMEWFRSRVVRGAGGGADASTQQLFHQTVTRQIAISPTQTAPLKVTFDFRQSRLRIQTTVPAKSYRVNFLQSTEDQACTSRLTGSGLPPDDWIDLTPCRSLVSSRGVVVSYRTEQDEAVVHFSPPPVIRLDQLTVRVPSAGHERSEILRPGRYFRVDYEFLMPVPTLSRANSSYPDKAPELRLQCYNPVSGAEIFVPVPPGTMRGHFFLPIDPTEQNHNDWQTPAEGGREPSRTKRREENLRQQLKNWEVGWDVPSLAPAVVRDGSISEEGWQAVFLPPPYGSAGTHPAVPGRGVVVKVATAQGECLFDTSSVSQLHLASHILIDGWFPEDAPPPGSAVGGGPSLSLEDTSSGMEVVVHNGQGTDMLMIRNKGYIVSSRPLGATEYQEADGKQRIPAGSLWFAGVSEGESVEISIVREPGVGHTITVPFSALPPQATLKPAWYEVLSDTTGGTEGHDAGARFHFSWPRGWPRGDQAEAFVDERTMADLADIDEPVWVKARVRLPGLAGEHPDWHGVSMIPWLPGDRGAGGQPPDTTRPPDQPDTWNMATDRKEYNDLEPVGLYVWIPAGGHPPGYILPDGQVRFHLTTGSVLHHNMRSFGQDITGLPTVVRHPGEHHPLPIAEMPVGYYELHGHPGKWNRYVLPPAIMSRPYHLRSMFYDIYQTKTQMAFGRQIVLLYLHQKGNWQEVLDDWPRRRETSLAVGKVVCTDTDMILRGTPHVWSADAAAHRNFGAATESFPYPSVRPPVMYHPYGEGFLNPVAMYAGNPFRMVVDRFRDSTGGLSEPGSHFDITAGPCRGIFYPTGDVPAQNMKDYLFLAADRLEYPSGEEGKEGISLRNPSRDMSGGTSGVEYPGHENVVIAGAPVFPIMEPRLTTDCVDFVSPPVVDRLSVPAFSKSQITVTVEAGKFSYGVIEAGGKPTFIFRSGRYTVEVPEGTNRVSVQVSLYSIGCTVQSTYVVIEREQPPAQQWAVGTPENFPESDTEKQGNIWQGSNYPAGRERFIAMGLDYQKKKTAETTAQATNQQNLRGMLTLNEAPSTARRDRNW